VQSTFVAGIDTNAATILWAMSELVRNARVLNKAQAEVRAAVGGGGGGQVQPDDMAKLSYLRMVVKETLRLHPPAPPLPTAALTPSCAFLSTRGFRTSSDIAHRMVAAFVSMPATNADCTSRTICHICAHGHGVIDMINCY